MRKAFQNAAVVLGCAIGVVAIPTATVAIGGTIGIVLFKTGVDFTNWVDSKPSP